MKKNVFLGLVLSCSIFSFAQKPTKKDTIKSNRIITEKGIDYMDNTNATPQSAKVPENLKKDCCAMLDNKMMCIKNDKKSAMESDVTLKNGTVVTTNGAVKKGAKVIQLKNGECIDMDGNVKEFKQPNIKEENQEIMQSK